MLRARISLAPPRWAATRSTAIVRGFPSLRCDDARDGLGHARSVMTEPRSFPAASELSSNCSLAARAQAFQHLVAHYRCHWTLDRDHGATSPVTTCPAPIR